MCDEEEGEERSGGQSCSQSAYRGGRWRPELGMKELASVPCSMLSCRPDCPVTLDAAHD